MHQGKYDIQIFLLITFGYSQSHTRTNIDNP